MIKIAFFDTKEYDKKIFGEYNKEYKYDIKYFDSQLNKETAPLAKGFDVVCDCCGNSHALSNGLMFTKPNGNLTLVGISLGMVQIPLVMGVMKEINIKGSIGYKREEFDDVIELASKGKINLAKYIDDIVTLDDVQKAYERLTNGMDDAIKILVDPNKHKIIEL